MNKLANVKSGELYAIPLFLTEYQDSKSFSREKFEEPDKQFVFCSRISEEESQKYELWIVWRSSQVENRILKLLNAP